MNNGEAILKTDKSNLFVSFSLIIYAIAKDM